MDGNDAKPFTVGIDESELVHILGMEDPTQSLRWLLARVDEQLIEIRVVERELRQGNPDLQQQVKSESDRLAAMKRRIEHFLEATETDGLDKASG